jgi:hypothetical protein
MKTTANAIRVNVAIAVKIGKETWAQSLEIPFEKLFKQSRGKRRAAIAKAAWQCFQQTELAVQNAA